MEMLWMLTRKKERERTYRVVRPSHSMYDLRLTTISDASIEAPPSLMPQRHYCDITGLEVRHHLGSRFMVINFYF